MEGGIGASLIAGLAMCGHALAVLRVRWAGFDKRTTGCSWQQRGARWKEKPANNAYLGWHV